ncbi:UDP-2,3-diacylglucosamine diphosphatase [Zhongshania sp.]|uniref:UDP-2,3-diacylglucosamine diphosphatase n=1 Tax=Zhongshania sp. TaxID=1971902 RepID=UPI001B5140DF|nr:UDP-2,3-diacylglucosamine diphosphatase [Zhongshania sp.]MBQ0795957.1 UDP-2,3-diacylglucosamine diphosphatase [Zhongshania sp.]
MSTLFISDLHLDESRPEITRAFFSFLKTTASDASDLYILGDFFESWVGDDDESPFINSVKQALKDFTDRGASLYFMHGNRDFLIGDTFCRDVGAELLPDPSVISLAGEQTLLMHGDSLCTDDQDYMQFRKMARDPLWQQDALSKSLAERRAIAKHMRMVSGESNSNKATDIMDVNASAVNAEMAKHGCTRLIHGHTHRPNRHSITTTKEITERIVLGDWDHQLWYLKVDNNEISLNSATIVS